jgi:hypothetical protein
LLLLKSGRKDASRFVRASAVAVPSWPAAAGEVTNTSAINAAGIEKALEAFMVSAPLSPPRER